MAPERITLQAVADAAGVSIASASRALSGRHGVSDDVATAVHEAARRLGYVPNHAARALRSERSMTVGLVVPRISNPFFPSLIEAIERALYARSYSLLICDSGDDIDEEAARVEALLNRGVDGLLIIPCDIVRSVATLRSSSRRVPVVQVDRAIDGLSGDRIQVDHRAGIGLAVDELVRSGCERLAFVSAQETVPTGRERLDGLHMALRLHHLPYEPRVLLGTFTPEWGVEAAERLLAADPMVDGVVCGNDLIAMGVIGTLTAADLRVPEDVGVTGFDNIAFAALSRPPLTTIEQPVDELGAGAVELLLDRLERPTRPPRRIDVTPLMIARGSTRAQAAEVLS